MPETSSLPGGALTLADDLVLSRMGYGAMQLAGPGVFGPPADRDEAIAVLRAVVERGVRHIDTADFYGPTVVNELIREALSPYPDDLRIVTKVGATRGSDGSWIHDRTGEAVVAQAHDNLKHLGVEALDVVNLRMGAVESPTEESLAEPFEALADLQRQGLIHHLGVSCVTPTQVTEAQSIAPVVTVQNHYNVAHRVDEPLLEACAKAGIAFVPYFPLGGFTPLQSEVLAGVASRLGASTQRTALAWLLQRSPAIAVIPGTSTRRHLDDNLAAADFVLPADAIAELDAIGS